MSIYPPETSFIFNPQLPMARSNATWEKARERFEKEAATQGVRRLNVNVPAGLHRQFKIKAAKEGETMSDVVMRLVWEYVKEF